MTLEAAREEVPPAVPDPEPSSDSPELIPIETPELTPVQTRDIGPVLASFMLADRLDLHRDLLPLQLGARVWNVSLASDPAFKVMYLTFAGGGDFLLRRIEDPNRLRGEGVIVTLDPQTHYRFKVSANFLNPVRGSTVHVDPVQGTRGPTHKFPTGKVVDAVKARSVVFQTGGREYWTLYGTDVDPATDRLAGTRSLLFINEAGISSKAWAVAEGSLAPDTPMALELKGARVVLVKTTDGRLRIHQASPSAPSD